MFGEAFLCGACMQCVCVCVYEWVGVCCDVCVFVHLFVWMLVCVVCVVYVVCACVHVYFN